MPSKSATESVDRPARTASATPVQTLTVAPEEAELRLDRWFRSRFPGLTHGRLEKLLRTGQVRIDGRRARAGTRLEAGQRVRVPPLPEAARPAPTPAPVKRPSVEDTAELRGRVLHCDDWLVAIDKPAGLAVQGGSGQTRHLDAMLEALRFDAPERPRLVHRLDRDTSGVLLLARSAAAARRLAAAFRGRDAEKLYWALVVGRPEPPRGRIELALAKRGGAGGERSEAEVEAGEDAKPAVTLYQLVAKSRLGPGGLWLSWLLLRPLTGRTHQLRAHCAALGTPILGDGKYGGRDAFPARAGRPLTRRLMLHAREIALPHPEDGTTLRIAAAPPPDMAEALAQLGFELDKAEAAAESLARLAAGQSHSPPRKDRAAPKKKTKGKSGRKRGGRR